MVICCKISSSLRYFEFALALQYWNVRRSSVQYAKITSATNSIFQSVFRFPSICFVISYMSTSPFATKIGKSLTALFNWDAMVDFFAFAAVCWNNNSCRWWWWRRHSPFLIILTLVFPKSSNDVFVGFRSLPYQYNTIHHDGHIFSKEISHILAIFLSTSRFNFSESELLSLTFFGSSHHFYSPHHKHGQSPTDDVSKISQCTTHNLKWVDGWHLHTTYN